LLAAPLRTAGMGGVVGLDWPAALAIGTARGCDGAILSRLLVPAEAGLMAGLEKRSGD